jgi:hypothetical protein
MVRLLQLKGMGALGAAAWRRQGRPSLRSLGCPSCQWQCAACCGRGRGAVVAELQACAWRPARVRDADRRAAGVRSELLRGAGGDKGPMLAAQQC